MKIILWLNRKRFTKAFGMVSFIVALSFQQIAHAQNINDVMNDTTLTTFIKVINKYDSTERKTIQDDTTRHRYLSEKAFDKLFDKYFSLITYSRESMAQGNSATFTVSDDETYFNLGLARYGNANFTSLGAKVNLIDNTGSFFSKDKPNNVAQVFLNQSFLLQKLRTVHFEGRAAERNIGRRTAILDSLQMVVLQFYKDFKGYQSSKAIIKKKIDSLTNLNPVFGDSTYSALIKTKASLRLLMSDSLRFYTWGSETGKKVTDAITELSTDRELGGDGLLGVSIHWVSFGLGYQNDSYHTFDSLETKVKFDTRKFDQISFNGSYNRLFQRFLYNETQTMSKKKKSFYYAVTYSATKTNSYALLEGSDIEYITRRIDSTHYESTTNKVKDKTGVDWRIVWSHKVSLQFTSMFSNKTPIGINMIANVEAKNGYKTTGALRLGLLYKFVQTDDPKSNLNLELFVNFTDLADSKKTGVNWFDRKSFGLTASVPFNKLFF